MSKEVKCKYCDKVYRTRGWHYRHLARKHPDCPELFYDRMFLREAVGAIKAYVSLVEAGKRKDMPSRPIKWLKWNEMSEPEFTL